MLFLQNFCFSFIYLYVGVCGSWDIRYIFHWKFEMQCPNAHPSCSYIFLRSIPATSTLNREAKWNLFRALKLASSGRDRSWGSLLGGSRVYRGTSRNRERGRQGRRKGMGSVLWQRVRKTRARRGLWGTATDICFLGETH